MSQTTASASAATSNLLQLHHNFRWILCSTHAEPVAGFLQRHLRRRLIAARSRATCSGDGEMRAPATDDKDDDDDDDDDDGDDGGGGDDRTMGRVVDWLPRAWQQVNRFLEARCPASHLTIGTLTLL